MRRNNRSKILAVAAGVACLLLLVISLVCFYSANWYVTTYGKTGFDSIIYTLFSNLGGTQSELIVRYMDEALLPAVMISIAVGALLLFNSRRVLYATVFGKWKIRIYPLKPWLSRCVCLAVSCVLLTDAAVKSEFADYVHQMMNPSTLFEEMYQDPQKTTIRFPEQKRNLIYIFLESMETSFFSKAEGGALEYNVIPELYQLAQENISFSDQEQIGGIYNTNGATWTMGAMVAHSAGIPLKVPAGIDANEFAQNGNFLPGVTALSDILHENGYYQTLMIGSDAAFGDRDKFYNQHQIDHIYDVNTATADGITEEGYYVWWGFEDSKLYTYAKQELKKISCQEQPFAFTLLTVDTHGMDGYICQSCGQDYAEQYENVYRCASRQIGEFIEWLQQQDFYENTTVVIVGDHVTMDYEYISRNVDESYDRRVYNCILNAAIPAVHTKNRTATTMDLFPTTLAAMGCQIEGDRLGLGTNLFSGTSTLAEEMGLGMLNREIGRYSNYYFNRFYFS